VLKIIEYKQNETEKFKEICKKIDLTSSGGFISKK
jgi:hypothetical protein